MSSKNPGLLGRKIGMTQIFDNDGNVIPVTVVEAGPCTVTQVKTQKSDGYNALQLGFGQQKAHRITKAEAGHTAKAGAEGVREIREILIAKPESYTLGQKLTVSDVFKSGQKVDVVGTSKGAGFAGVMKRHHFKGFIEGHGTHEYFRHGGSIGTRLTPGMVQKGMKMPGHKGDARVTVQSLTIAKIDAEKNLLYIKGSVPGANGGIVVIQGAVKA